MTKFPVYSQFSEHWLHGATPVSCILGTYYLMSLVLLVFMQCRQVNGFSSCHYPLETKLMSKHPMLGWGSPNPITNSNLSAPFCNIGRNFCHYYLISALCNCRLHPHTWREWGKPKQIQPKVCFCPQTIYCSCSTNLYHILMNHMHPEQQKLSHYQNISTEH